MFSPEYIVHELSANKSVFESLLSGISNEEYLWRMKPEKWCLLEIVCHLHDEEREDFRARLKHVLMNPELSLPPINPQGWVAERKYIEQDYKHILTLFLQERNESVKWLGSLENSEWDRAHAHPKFGPMNGKLFLSNWLAHDYLHIRQIITLKFHYLKSVTGEELNYAGEW